MKYLLVFIQTQRIKMYMQIPFSWDERKLKEKFRQAGLIENVDIKMKDGKSRGFGLIRYATPEQANKAVGKLFLFIFDNI